MKKTKKHKGAIWDYLETTGVLENGTDEEIKQAKKAYRKAYYLDYKRNQRANKPEFIVNFSTNNAEYSKVASASKRHHLTITAFIRCAVLAYIDMRFVVPNPDQVAALEQILSQCLNEVQGIVKVKEKYHWEREQKFEAIEKRIDKLESEINLLFRHPPQIKNDSQSQII
jgi:hypothetical protein